MLPNLSFNDCVNSAESNVESLSQYFKATIFTRNVSRANFSHDSFIDNNHRMPFAFKRAILAHHICAIISTCSSKKMFRATTRWVITMVQYVQSFWNRTVNYNPSNFMGRSDSSFAIAAFSFWASPNPAITRFIDLLPKSLNSSRSIIGVVANLRAVVVKVASPALKRLFARPANARYFGFCHERIVP